MCEGGKERERMCEGGKVRGEITHHLNSLVGSPSSWHVLQCLLHDWCLFAN